MRVLMEGGSRQGRVGVRARVGALSGRCGGPCPWVSQEQGALGLCCVPSSPGPEALASLSRQP